MTHQASTGKGVGKGCPAPLPVLAWWVVTPYHVTHKVEHLFLKFLKYDSVIPKLLTLISLQNITLWSVHIWKRNRTSDWDLLIVAFFLTSVGLLRSRRPGWNSNGRDVLLLVYHSTKTWFATWAESFDCVNSPLGRNLLIWHPNNMTCLKKVSCRVSYRWMIQCSGRMGFLGCSWSTRPRSCRSWGTYRCTVQGFLCRWSRLCTGTCSRWCREGRDSPRSCHKGPSYPQPLGTWKMHKKRWCHQTVPLKSEFSFIIARSSGTVLPKIKKTLKSTKNEFYKSNET